MSRCRDLAVTMWVARTDAKGRGRHVLGHLSTPPTPRCVTRLDLPLTYWASPCARATPRSTHGRSGIGRPHCRRVVVASPTPAPTTPQKPSPFYARLVEQATLGDSVGYREESRRQALWDLAAGKAVSHRRHLRRISSNT
jgi:hypothetical protein